MAGAAQGTGNTGQVQGWAGARGHAECGRGRTPAAQTGSGFLSQSGVIDVETALGSPLPLPLPSTFLVLLKIMRGKARGDDLVQDEMRCHAMPCHAW
jgi:hypothetical protein